MSSNYFDSINRKLPPHTIAEEAFSRVSLQADLSNVIQKYTDGNITFPTFMIETFEKYYYYLLMNSDVISLDQKFRMRPSYLSIELYGTPAFEYLLMYINDVFIPEDFVMSEVYAPRTDAISEMLNDVRLEEPVLINQ